MIAKSKSYRHRCCKIRIDRPRSHGGEITVDAHSEAIGRRVALHVQDRQFDVARNVITETERELEAARPQYTSLEQVPLVEMEFDTRVFNALYDQQFRTAADLAAVSYRRLRSIPNFGPGTVGKVRRAVERWIEYIAAAP